MTGRNQLLLILGLSILAGAQAAGMLLTQSTRADSLGIGAYISVEPGFEIQTHVRESNAHESLSVTGIMKGQCTYAVIYSPTCKASVAAARRWMQISMVESDSVVLPPEWQAIWISVEDSAASADALPAGFPFLMAFRSSSERLESELGIRAYPVFVTLDRDGRVTGSGVGAALFDRSAFSSDCLLRPSIDSTTGLRL